MGKERPYSGTLVQGIGDTLCILAIHGDGICGSRLGDVEERAAQLHRLVARNRQIGLRLCLALLPKVGGGSAGYIAKPRWRPHSTEVPQPTWGEIWRTREVAREIPLGLRPHQVEELVGIFQVVEAFPSEEMGALLDAVEAWRATDPKIADFARLREAVRSARRFAALQLAEPVRLPAQGVERFRHLVETLDDLIARLEPADLVERHRWLFQSAWIEWPTSTALGITENARPAFRRRVRRQLRRRSLMGVSDGVVAAGLCIGDPGQVRATWIRSGKT